MFRNGTSRIFGGVAAKDGQIPYVVRIVASLENSERHSFCGGSLIRLNWVLTAGHCLGKMVNGIEKFWDWIFILSGAANLSDDEYDKNQHRQIAQFRINIGNIVLFSTLQNAWEDLKQGILLDLCLSRLPRLIKSILNFG